MRSPTPPPLPDWQVQQKRALKARRAEDRKALFQEIIARIVVGGGCAAVAYFFFPGSQVFDKGLASLTLGDIGALAFAGMFASAAFRILTGENAS
ncbi:hypothetical protein [Bradyrhizobium sp. SZCCHNR1075]|uniref:hypothetical protein n=1 Tax=Bradyrhizobium sp. SZCCHNR1075 TaxID=3057362 RepID=UPI0028E4B9B9|nr:hypothetical protein [Bradyrhizobium sp. SZCCHNR1075]